MLAQGILHQVRQNSSVLWAHIDTGVNRRIIAVLLPEFDEKFKCIMADLKEVCITALFPPFCIFVTHSCFLSMHAN